MSNHRPIVAAALLLAIAAPSARAAVIDDTITGATFGASNDLRVGGYDLFAGEVTAHDYTMSTRIWIAEDPGGARSVRRRRSPRSMSRCVEAVRTGSP